MTHFREFHHAATLRALEGTAGTALLATIVPITPNVAAIFLQQIDLKDQYA